MQNMNKFDRMFIALIKAALRSGEGDAYLYRAAHRDSRPGRRAFAKMLLLCDWDEGEHPRGKGGKFRRKGAKGRGGGGTRTRAYSLSSGKRGSRKRKIPVDGNGVSYTKPRATNISAAEHEKITHEISSNYGRFEGEKICKIVSYSLPTKKRKSKAYEYWFENHGIGNYNIFSKKLDKDR